MAFSDGVDRRCPFPESDDPVLNVCGSSEPFAGGDAISATSEVCYTTPGDAFAIFGEDGEDRFWLSMPVRSVPAGARVVAVRYLLAGRVEIGGGVTFVPNLPHAIQFFYRPEGATGAPPPTPDLFGLQAVPAEDVDPNIRHCSNVVVDEPFVVPDGQILWVMLQMRETAGDAIAFVSCRVPDGVTPEVFDSQAREPEFPWANAAEFNLDGNPWIEVEYESP